MSIHPEFVRLILNGNKKVEFRKIRFSMNISYVVIYATLPIKKIVGYFEVKNINTASPDELWRSYENIAGIEKERFGSIPLSRKHGEGENERVALG
jgi:predicted transcriptional regulator